MDIKEIALKVADSLRNKIDGISHMQSNQGLVRFAEALVAEIAKQNEPIGAIQNGKFQWNTDGGPEKWRARKDFSGKLYTLPPTAEQIANETAEAIARMLENGSFLTPESRVALAANGAAKAIRSGAWKEFKKWHQRQM